MNKDNKNYKLVLVQPGDCITTSLLSEKELYKIQHDGRFIIEERYDKTKKKWQFWIKPKLIGYKITYMGEPVYAVTSKQK